MSTVQLLLSALGHPQADSVQLTALRQLVFWLEDRKIRAYKQENRTTLAAYEAPDWQAAYDKYLQHVGCPAPISAQQQEAQLLWLLRLAVAREYEDASGKVDLAPPPAAAPVKEAAAKPHLDVTSTAAQEQLQELLKSVSAVAGSAAIDPATPLPQALQEAHTALVHQVLPALTAAQQGTGDAAASDFTLGFSTQDAGVDQAATLLRVLYTQELRKLQSLVDDTIVEVQEFTANPRTDSALGRTGR